MNGKLLVLLTAIISGISIFVNKFGVAYTNPYVFTFIKNVSVALLLLCIVMFFRYKEQLMRLTKSEWRNLISIGLIGGSIPFLMFFKGLSMTSSAQAAFIHKSMFIFVAGLAAYVLKEKINRQYIAAALILLAGNALLIGLTSFEPSWGDALVLGATLLWAVENTLSKHTLKTVSPMIVAWGRMFFGSIFILGFLLSTGNAAMILTLSAEQVAWAVVPTLFLASYVIFWYHGLQKVRASTATAILLLGSVITTLLNLAYSTSLPSVIQTTAISMICIGVLWMWRQTQKQRIQVSA